MQINLTFLFYLCYNNNKLMLFLQFTLYSRENYYLKLYIHKYVFNMLKKILCTKINYSDELYLIARHI